MVSGQPQVADVRGSASPQTRTAFMTLPLGPWRRIPSFYVPTTRLSSLKPLRRSLCLSTLRYSTKAEPQKTLYTSPPLAKINQPLAPNEQIQSEIRCVFSKPSSVYGITSEQILSAIRAELGSAIADKVIASAHLGKFSARLLSPPGLSSSQMMEHSPSISSAVQKLFASFGAKEQHCQFRPKTHNLLFYPVPVPPEHLEVVREPSMNNIAFKSFYMQQLLTENGLTGNEVQLISPRPKQSSAKYWIAEGIPPSREPFGLIVSILVQDSRVWQNLRVKGVKFWGSVVPSCTMLT
ncbi:hypothetical protein DL96DRAFT_245347 [Flagelloscypha sp. PMI_526]|nr:hypothetical protein DL96DRAFT_245347 [Flagelloscypha sp. PMI_526]